jgi:hypothetical protein
MNWVELSLFLVGLALELRGLLMVVRFVIDIGDLLNRFAAKREPDASSTTYGSTAVAGVGSVSAEASTLADRSCAACPEPSPGLRARLMIHVPDPCQMNRSSPGRSGEPRKGDQHFRTYQPTQLGGL